MPTFASLPNKFGFAMRLEGFGYDFARGELANGFSTANATGESLGGIGYLHWDDEATHTVSSSGGKIYWLTASATFANAGSEFRVGIQDVSGSTEDGTFDVHAALVGGTDPITANAVNTAVMTTGSKSIAHRALVAIVCEFTVRAGVDDINIVRKPTGGTGLPYGTLDVGAGVVRDSGLPLFLVESDDGHFGWLHPQSALFGTLGTYGLLATGTPDEAGLIFQVPWRCKVNGIWFMASNVDANENATARIYDDPIQAPHVKVSTTFTSANNAANGAQEGMNLIPIDETELDPNNDYCVALEALGATAFNLINVTLVHANARKATVFGTTARGGTRTNGLGGSSPVFTESTTVMPVMGIQVSAIEKNAAEGPGPHGMAFFG